ncbi:hypothetical protein J22TS1_43450 [Siminovitchia terrae]|uniref:M23 family metallopeptidase n=1 Tax=Siminovitchia terrae TaxID=1914933 RepID=UPI001B18024C|nr:M23 family metallopeptidase [Siminovitchia terrae]GIN93294.1 hypothetical protein J22TS1_43450 [Siminovitchia terrae]
MFLWPTTTRCITSHFRPAHRKAHHGLDIAEPGTHEVFAAADGTVSRSYRSTSYGECVMIVHSINGQIWETVYAHMRAGFRRVREGQKVKRSQVIGIMGNTGHSTGQHLHFEVHRGRWNINKTNAVNPLNYLDGSSASKNTSNGSVLVLPKSSSSWRVFPLNKAPIKGNEKGFLNPAKFGGLEYKILRNPQTDVYTIKTSNFGIVNIYAGKETEAKIVNKKKRVYLPASDSSWRVYPLDKAPKKGNEKGFLKPSKFGGLDYEILDSPQKDVYTIQTSDFGKVNIFAAPSTGTIIN